jgi:hypothetical protein
VVRIWVRATLDFDDEEAFRAQLHPQRRESVALWDSLFEMPWRVFRSRIRAIARTNLERVEGAVCASWEEIPEGALVLPCDDDDWFRPDVARVIEGVTTSGVTGVRWYSSFLEVPTDWRHQLGIWRRRVQGPRPQFLCTTNNYALFASEASKELLVNHLKASSWVGAQPPGAVPYLNERLSLMNRTIASDTSLRPQQQSIGRRHLLRKLRRYQRLYDHALPPELAWAQPYADEMGELMRELELR